MKPRSPSAQLDRAAAHLLRARAELDEAAHTLGRMSDAPADRLELAGHIAAEQARLAEALAAAIHAAPSGALDKLLATLAGDGEATARSRRH